LSSSDQAAWLDRLEGLFDRPCSNPKALAELERATGLADVPRYLLLRGRARYLADQVDEALGDYLQAWALSRSKEDTTTLWVCVRLAQLHLAAGRVDEAEGWIERCRGRVGEDPRLKGELAVLEGRVVRFRGRLDEAEARFLDAEMLFGDVACSHRVVAAIRFRLEVDAERASPDGPEAELRPLHVRELIDAAESWGVPPEEWLPVAVSRLTDDFLQPEPTTIEMLTDLTATHDPLIPDDARFEIGWLLQTAGERELAAHHLEIASRQRDELNEAWLAGLFLAADRLEGDPEGARAELKGLLDPARYSGVEPLFLVMAAGALMDADLSVEVRDLCERAIENAEDDGTIQMARANLVGCLVSLGDLDGAREQLALIPNDAFEDDPELAGVTAQNRGIIALRSGSPEDALRLLDKAVEQLRSGGFRRQEAAALSMMAVAALAADETELALGKLYEIGDLESLPPAVRATVHLAWGEILHELGYQDAVDEYGTCAEIASACGNKTLEAAALVNLAALLVDLGAVDDADHAARDAASIAADITHLRALALRICAIAAASCEDEGRARRLFRRAAKDFRASGMLMLEADCWDSLAILGRRTAEQVRSARKALRVASAVLCFVEGHASRLALRGRMRPFGVRLVEALLESRYPEAALAAACEVKASGFLGLLRETRREAETIDPALLTAMKAAVASGAAEAHSGQSARLRHVPATMPRPMEAFSAFTAARTPAADAKVDPERILSRLAPDEAAVEYFPTGDHVLIFACHRGRVRCYRRRLRQRHIAAVLMLADVAQGLSHGGDPALLVSWLRLLHDLLVKPLHSLPDRVRRVWLAPGGLLERVPFEALLDSSGRTLLERVETVRLPTSAHLALLPRRRRQLRHALVLRGADGAQTLHHAALECGEVRAMAAAAGLDVFDEVGRESLATVDLLHYAGHAEFEPGAAAIFLGQERVAARDLVDLPLDARPTVVLSACESGRSETGCDELDGFLRAFFAAGARDVVCSGWLADDGSTRRVMRLFYEGLLDRWEPPATALRTAALEVRRQFSHPFHWANFRCYGLG